MNEMQSQHRLAKLRGGSAAGWLKDADALADLTAYIAVAAGYLVAMFSANGGRPSVTGFLVLTAATIAWLWLYHLFTPQTAVAPKTVWLTLGLIGLTLLAEGATPLGVGFDWLLPIVTVSIFSFCYSTRPAVLWGLLVYGLTMACLWVIGGEGAGAAGFVFNVVIMTPAYIFCVIFSIIIRRQREQGDRSAALISQLEAAQRQLQTYAAQVEELTTTRERNRMAREIHDTLGHYLTILAVQLETAIKLEERADPRLREELVEARRVATECLAEVRRSVAALRPAGATGDFGAALRRLVAEAQVIQPETAITLDVEGPHAAIQALSPELRVALFRCAQEALTNIRKHAQATQALVRLRVDAQQVELTILDNGVGEQASKHQVGQGFGLQGMRERLELLGGAAQAQPAPGRGWRVEVTAPITPEPLIESQGEPGPVVSANGIYPSTATPMDHPATEEAHV